LSGFSFETGINYIWKASLKVAILHRRTNYFLMKEMRFNRKQLYKMILIIIIQYHHIFMKQDIFSRI